MAVDEDTEEKSSRKIETKTHLFQKQKKWGVGELNSCWNLIGQSSHLPCAFNYVRAFRFCPAQEWILRLEPVTRHLYLYNQRLWKLSLSFSSDSQVDTLSFFALQAGDT